MGSKSKIEWLEGGASWNFLYGCTKLSAGCKNCYAERVTPRLVNRNGGANYQGRVTVYEPELSEPSPLAWTRARKVFVCSLSDLFHEAVPDAVIERAFEVMRNVPRHTYIVLTKRPARARGVLARIASTHGRESLRNVWAGASIEDQTTAWRAGVVFDFPTPVRLLSLEPLLGPVDVAPYLGGAGVNWCIVGGESGRQRPRLMEEKWVRRIVKDCKAARVPAFVKQMGTAWASRLRECLPPNRLDTKGNQPYAWPEDLRVREVPRG